MLPEYACAIIRDPRGHLLLQLRPPTARFAANQLTCFGGRRETDEDDHQCLHRELIEELDWTPACLTPACDLWEGPRFIARFFHAAWNDQPLRTEAGHVAIWAPICALPGLPVSGWHEQVLRAVGEGRRRVSL